MTSYNRDYWMAFGAHQKATVGDMKFSVTNYDHMGWMKCDGRTLNKADFEFLFKVIGYSFGGSGSQFQLPNPAGRVPGVVGTGHDSNPVYSTITMTLGSNIGEYQHKLLMGEMPSHNHGVDGVNQISTNNSTSVAYTGLTVLVSTTKITDSGHTHGYRAPRPYQIAATSGGDVCVGYNDATTGSSSANIVDPGHRHDVSDPGHRHTLNPAGMDQYHNNIQPTIPMGNMFIYNGRPLWGVTPYGLTSTIW